MLPGSANRLSGLAYRQGMMGFGQTQRLTVRLRGIIRGYPRGIGIIKEFIQNADDSGASYLRIVLDGRTHAVVGLPDSRMSAMMGPALLLTNDRRFTEADLTAIQRLEESSKTASGPKTGKFGLGFNTAYNVTDYPCFLTNGSIYCFDPHQHAAAKAPDNGEVWPLAEAWNRYPVWPGVFEPGGLSHGDTDFAGTIFRLPLRTAIQATQSEICDEPFLHDHFLALVAQVEANASELLLFTKNLLQLVIEELDQSGARRTLLSVRTRNADYVRRARAPVLDSMGDAGANDLPARLRQWAATHEPLPLAHYDHIIDVEGASSRTERWRLVIGLVRGKQNGLINAALEMERHKEKALPLLGVATLLGADGSVEPCSGHLFCGQPLPASTPLPVHVNGYFDLDQSRQRLTIDVGEVGLAIQARRAWNRVLLDEGVAWVWHCLLRDLAAAGVGNAYAAWPDARWGDALLARTARATYQLLSECPVLPARTDAGAVVMSAEGLKLPTEAWRQALDGPLRADGLVLPSPPLPPHVEAGFGSAIGTFTPADLRQRLRVTADVNVPIAAAPRACLRRRDWIVTLLRFALTDDVKELSGLPLALHSDGHLHTFGFSSYGVAFISGPEPRQIFEAHPGWFLDADFVRDAEISPNAAGKVVELGSHGVIVNLNHVVGKERVRPWVPDASQPPHAAWLRLVWTYLGSHRVATEDLGALGGLALLPATDGLLHAASGDDAPLLVSVEDEPSPLVKTLRALGVPLLLPSNDVVALTSPFQASHPDFLRSLGTLALIRLLHARRGELQITSTQASILVDYLAQRHGSYAPPYFAKLRQLAIFPAASGVVAPDQAGVYRTAGFDPPALGLGIHLIEGRSQWVPLLDGLSVAALDRSRFVLEQLVPALPTLSPGDRDRAWCWIRDDLWGELMADSGASLRRALGAVAAIPGSDGQLHAAAALHDPDSDVIQEVLGDAAIRPLPISGSTRDWHRFLRQLGMAAAPRPHEIINHVRALAAIGPEAEAGLFRVFTYVSENVKALSGCNVRTGSVTQSFFQALSVLAWCPAVLESDEPAFQPPPVSLFRTADLFLDIDLVGSQRPVFRWRISAELTKELGVERRPPLTLVLDHLDRLVAAWSEAPATKERGQVWSEALATVYRYVGRFLDSRDGEYPVTRSDRVRLAKYADTGILWDVYQHRFWEPRRVFARGVPSLSPFYTCLEAERDVRRAGFSLLGVRAEPTGDDYIAFLRELKGSLTAALTDVQRNQAIQALRELPTGQLPIDLPVPTQDGRLLAANELYYDDAPWLRERLASVPLTAREVPVGVITRLGIRSVAAHAVEILASGERGIVDAAVVRWCADAQIRLGSEPFLQGVRRLVRHYHGLQAEPKLRQIGMLTIVPLSKLETTLTITDVGELGTAAVRSFYSAERTALLLTGTSISRLRTTIARTIERLLGPLAPPNLAPLEHILECDLGDIADILDDDRISAYEEAQLHIEWGSPEGEGEQDASIADDQEATPASAAAGRTGLGGGGPGGVWRGRPESSGEAPVVPPSDGPLPSDAPLPGSDSQTGSGEPVEEHTRDGNPTVNGSGSVSVGGGWGGRGGSSAAPTVSTTARNNLLDELLAGDHQIERDPNTLWSSADARLPPTQAGIGRSVVSRGGSGGGERMHLALSDGETDSGSGEIDLRALEHVERIERAAGRRVERVSDPALMGYDLDSIAETEPTDIRFIKVRGVPRDWRDRPVHLTRYQFDALAAKGERSWLYVVERLDGTPRHHFIHNPTSRMQGFAVPASWARLSVTYVAPGAPAIGLRLFQGEKFLGTIIAVEGTGILRRVRYQPSQDAPESVTFRPTLHRLEDADGQDDS